MNYGVVILAGSLFAYSVLSRRLGRTVFTGPLVFATLGWIVGRESLGFGEGEHPNEIELIALLLEATLVLVLFSDAMGISLTNWREESNIPSRLLGIGLPLTVLSGWGLAVLLLSDLTFWEAGVIAIILAPTDAALGQAVVSNRRVPQRIRQALNIESGLNDGLALPVFFVLLQAAQGAEESATFAALLGNIAKEVLIAVAVGVVVGWLAARVIVWAAHRKWMAKSWAKVALLALAVGAWALGDGLGGSGFLAAWIAGATLGRTLRGKQPGIGEFTEDSSHLLTLLSFFVFGAFGLRTIGGDVTWQIGLYAVLSLTAVRMIPVALSVVGLGLRRPSVLYLGWFGPRGLASIILVTTILEDAELAGTATIAAAMTVTVGLSVYAHGVTAWWGSNRYAEWFEAHGERSAGLSESHERTHVPVSRRLGRVEQPLD